MQAGQNVKDSAARAYDSTTNTLGTPVKDKTWGNRNEDRGIMDKAGDHYQSAKDSVSDGAYRTGDAVSNAAGATKDAASRVTISVTLGRNFVWQEEKYGNVAAI